MHKYKNPWLTLTFMTLLSCGKTGSSVSALVKDTATQSALTSGGPVGSLSNPGFCMTIPNNASANGTRVQIYPCDGSDAQQWTYANGMISASNNRCLNVLDGGQGNNVRLQIWACSGTDKNNLFTVVGKTIRWPVNNKCVDVLDGNFASGTPLQMYDCYDDSPNQIWALNALQGGSSANSTQSTTPSPTTTSNNTSGGLLDGFVANAQKIAWSSWTPQNQSQGLVNNEQEAYVTDGSTISYNGDTLVITAYSNNNGYGWKSGKLLAPPLGNGRGYIEAKMYNPGAQGTWPAFWLMPNNNSPTWPQGGEIDIMEQVNGQPSQVMSMHYGPSPSQEKSLQATMNLSMSGQWHRYGLAWDQTHCAFYVDGVKVPDGVKYYPSDSPFAQQVSTYTPILNLAIGGGWPGYAPDSIGNQTLQVEYVVQSTETPSDF